VNESAMTSSIRRSALELIESVNGLIPEKEVLRLSEYVEYNELGLALEHLCDVIREQGICCPNSLRDQIVSLGERMQMDAVVWTGLSSEQ